MPNPLGAAASGAAAGSMITPGVGTAIGAGLGLVGGLADAYFGQKGADQSWKRQKKILKNQIQWRVEDAVAAGLHPLAALGVNAASGPAAAVGTDFQNMGANLGRAAEAYLRPEDKAAARLALLAEERAGLENDYLRAQIAGAHKALLNAGSTPGVASRVDPIPGTGLNLPVQYPGYGQKKEDDYGDFGGGMLGLFALMNDLANRFGGKPMLETTQKELKAITDTWDRMSQPWPPASQVPTQDLPSYLY